MIIEGSKLGCGIAFIENKCFLVLCIVKSEWPQGLMPTKDVLFKHPAARPNFSLVITKEANHIYNQVENSFK